jgi:hypothetical protein
MTTKSFDKWDTDDIERTFKIRRKRTHPTLTAWLAAHHRASERDSEDIEELRDSLLMNVNDWNEDELKFKFIAPFMRLIRYDTEHFRSFTQRIMTAIIDDIKLTGRLDFLVATGSSKPRKPFFFLHEYKKERGSDNDPRAQLLAEMLAARELNTTTYPLYGCYVVGRNWFFVILEGSEYAESDAFVATQEDIFQIFSILREAKAIIAQLAEQYP